MKSEYSKILKFSKEFIGKENLSKMKKIDDDDELTEGLKYLINSKLRLILLDLESSLSGVEKRDLLIVESKIKRLALKIKIFHSTYSKRDFDVIQNLIKEINAEVKNV